MSGSATIGTEQAILGHTLGFAPMAFPAQVFVGLCTTVPSATAGATEVAGHGYARMPGTFAIGSPTNVAVNTLTIEFPVATANWGSVGWFEVWDAAIAGNRLYWGSLVNPADGVTPTTLAVMSGDIVRFSPGTLTIQAR